MPTADCSSKRTTPGGFDLTDLSWIGSPKIDELYEEAIADLDPGSAAERADETDAATRWGRTRPGAAPAAAPGPRGPR